MKALLLYTSSGNTHPDYHEFTSVELTLDFILEVKRATGYPVIITDIKELYWLKRAYEQNFRKDYIYELKANHTEDELENIFDSNDPYPVIEIYNDDRE